MFCCIYLYFNNIPSAYGTTADEFLNTELMKESRARLISGNDMDSWWSQRCQLAESCQGIEIRYRFHTYRYPCYTFFMSLMNSVSNGESKHNSKLVLNTIFESRFLCFQHQTLTFRSDTVE